MSGIDEILELIAAQQKLTEDSIILDGDRKTHKILDEGRQNAQKAYDEYMQKAEKKAEKDYVNSCAAIDAEMKRKVLSCKGRMIDKTIEKVLDKLKNMPDKEYFELLEKLVSRYLKQSNGIVSLGVRDMARVPDDFEKRLSALAEKIGGTLKLASEPCDIENGFILSYGLISENCSFSAIIEAEKDDIRDTAAKVLFGQVKQ